MTLSEIRNLFIEISGRNDLIQAGTAVGADFFINEGCKELDRRLFGGKNEASYIVDLDAGQIVVPIPNCRVVRNVVIYNTSEKTTLEKADSLQEMRDYYDEPKASKTAETPYVFFPISARPYPNVLVASSYNQTWVLEDILEDGHENFSAILISPPPDLATYTLRVDGVFYSDELQNDGDYNFWTIKEPLAVVHAAMLKLEQTYRNMEGAKEWGAAVDSVVTPMNMDIVEEEIEGVNEMEG